MTRPITARMADALTTGKPRALFVSIDHPAGTGYFWSGIGKRSWNGQTWQGAGELGGVTPIKHSSEIAVQDITFSLSGIDPDIVSGLDDDVHNRNGSAWLACIGDSDDVIADPYQIIDSVLDFQLLSIGTDNKVTITITAHTGFYTLDRSVDEAWTPQNQRKLFPLYTGLDMIPSLQNQDLQWTPS